MDRFLQPAGLLLARSEAVARTSMRPQKLPIGGGTPGRDQRVCVRQRADVLGQRVAQRGMQQVRGPDIEVGLVLGRHRGRSSNLTESERDELATLVAKSEPRLFAGTAADKFSPIPLPGLVVRGRAKPKSPKRSSPTSDRG